MVASVLAPDLVIPLLRTVARARTPAWLPMSDKIVDAVVRARRFAAGLEEHSVTVDEFVIPYLEGGTGEPLVLLHGFSDRKDSFVESVRYLTRSYRVILPDLPGFSAASQPWKFVYSVENQARLFAGFFDRLGLEQFHLGGCSLGGAISARYAVDHPSRVSSLMLVGASGVRMPVWSPLLEHLQAGKNPFVVRNIAEFRAFMHFVLEIVPPYPAPVFRWLANEAMARAAMNQKIMDELLVEQLDLTPRLPELDVPALVLWGNRDRIIDPSAATVYHSGLRRSRLLMLDGVGHCPQYEVPDQTGAIVGQFLSDLA